MQVRHNVTKVEQDLTKKEWDVLVAEGYAGNFTVLSEDDYKPSELTGPAGKAKDKNTTPA